MEVEREVGSKGYMKTTEVDLGLLKIEVGGGRGQVSPIEKQGHFERRVFDSSNEKHCQGHHTSTLQTATYRHVSSLCSHT